MVFRILCICLLSTFIGFADVKEVSPQSFDKEIRSGKVVVDFYGPWCGPCKRLSPVLDQLAGEMEGKVGFIKVNIDQAPELADKNGVQVVPTLILFEDGKEKGRISGFRDKSALEQFVETGKIN